MINMLTFISIIFGVCSGIACGTADFSGGFVTKKKNVFSVLFISQLSEVILLFLSGLGFSEKISGDQIAFAIISGIFGSIGLLAFYKALAIGNMSVIAPITAVIAPLIPVLFNYLEEPYSSLTQIIAMTLAFVSIWLLTSTNETKKYVFLDIKLAVAAGLNFGIFLILINLASTKTSYFLPLMVARVITVLLAGLVLIKGKNMITFEVKSLFVICMIGIIDATSNILFILSVLYGRLDIASILFSMGPVITILLAWLIMKEKIGQIQALGIILAMFSIILLVI